MSVENWVNENYSQIITCIATHDFTPLVTECPGCETGVTMCHREPCALTPDEARALIERGFVNKLMIDWMDNEDGSVDFFYLICGAVGWEKKFCNVDFKIQETRGRCAFLTDDNKCELHDLGLKPIEGKTACCQAPHKNTIGFVMRNHVARLWKTEENQKFVHDLAISWGLNHENFPKVIP